MAMYFHDSLSNGTLRRHFEAAQRTGVRYIGVMQQVLDNPYAVTCDQSVISARDCEDIVRQIREHGLRPHAPRTTLYRLLDTREDFRAQVDMVALDSLAQNLTPAAKDAYERYLRDFAARASTPKPGLISRLFKR